MSAATERRVALRPWIIAASAYAVTSLTMWAVTGVSPLAAHAEAWEWLAESLRSVWAALTGVLA